MANFRFTWNGDQVAELTRENAAKALAEFGLTVEGEAKRELRKGHGVLTGTLRRSIHTALPGYGWSGDDVKDGGGPERGGQSSVPPENNLKIEVGSGMAYAMAIHQGWPAGYKKMRGSFAGYHFLTNGLKKAKTRLPSIIEKYKVK